jgi:hypothetical protein
MHRIRNILIIVLFIGLIITAIWFFVLRKNASDDTIDTDTQTPQAQDEEVEIIIPDWYETDKDGDGIEDTKEAELGTSVYEPDTDGDGLTDSVEINQYKTDPKNPDTDGDSYWDGLEILTGYNPLGEGKLSPDSGNQ